MCNLKSVTSVSRLTASSGDRGQARTCLDWLQSVTFGFPSENTKNSMLKVFLQSADRKNGDIVALGAVVCQSYFLTKSCTTACSISTTPSSQWGYLDCIGDYRYLNISQKEVSL